MEEIDSPSLPAPEWSFVRIGWYSAIVAFSFLAIQFAVMTVDLTILTLAKGEPDIEEWSNQIGSDGSFLIWVTIATTTFCSPLVIYLAKRREAEPWEFLRLIRTSPVVIFKWCLIIAAVLLASDALTIALGRPVVPPFMKNVYASAQPIPLFLALVFAAPFFEELFFRGFLIGSLDSVGIRMSISATFTSLAWAAIHSQYDAYGLLTIFFMGLVLALARYRTDSLVPCLAMHSLANAVAFTEAAVAAV